MTADRSGRRPAGVPMSVYAVPVGRRWEILMCGERYRDDTVATTAVEMRTGKGQVFVCERHAERYLALGRFSSLDDARLPEPVWVVTTGDRR